MGPEGGNGGGLVVAEGTPEQVAGVPASHTGKFLREILGADRISDAASVPAPRKTAAKKAVAAKSTTRKTTTKAVNNTATKKAATKTTATKTTATKKATPAKKTTRAGKA
jgi:excinuclease ABC subunit A